MTDSLPHRARVVVIGGGIIGVSVAYHLAKLGWTDVVVCERDKLTSGTTWHAAGLMVTFGSMSSTSTEMRMYTRDLYTRLEAETGLSTGFKPVGFVELAADEDRLEEYRRVAAFNRHLGVDVHEISPTEVADLFPLARTDDLLAGFYVPDDGRVNPVDATMSLAAGARRRGVTIAQNTPVTGLTTERGAVTGVHTPRGDIEAEYVVNCTGMWARQLGEDHGVTIPLQAAEHYYLITDEIPGLDPSWPVIEDPASYGYYREEVGGLMIGLFEPECAPWNIEAIPDSFSFAEIQPDWDRMGPYLEKAMDRVPISHDTGIRKFFCGPESFTPDLAPVVGEAPELRNYFVAAGLNSIGILTAGGLGRLVARWIVDGRPNTDVTGINIDRLHPYQTDPEYRRHRTAESLGMVYRCHYPNRSMQTARNVKLSPLHDRLARRGAHFAEVSGWESPGWYAPDGIEPRVERLSWQRENWFPYWQAEHEAIRNGVGLMDMSFMAKFRVEGRGAGRFLERLSANRVDGDSGRITYTQWLNEGGTIEADLTVTKLDEDRFWVVASDTAQRHVGTWMRRHATSLDDVSIAGVTASYAQINVHGPKSRELLASVTDTDLSNGRFPFRAAQRIDIGGASALCVRITYVGELGYELYVAADEAVAAYDALIEAGRSFDLQHAGLRALGSLRMEKAYRDYGHDSDNTDDPYEAGLGFAVDLDKPGGFIGRDAAFARREAGPPTRRLAQILLSDPDPLMFHGEIVHRNGRPIGYVRAASYGFTVGGAVGLAMIAADEPITTQFIEAGAWHVDIAGELHDATVSLTPLYDAKSSRVHM
ncbi:MAG TPA: FAD-dependent oxidoreductase [Acidimicrobiia bacterium]